MKRVKFSNFEDIISDKFISTTINFTNKNQYMKKFSIFFIIKFLFLISLGIYLKFDFGTKIKNFITSCKKTLKFSFELKNILKYQIIESKIFIVKSMLIKWRQENTECPELHIKNFSFYKIIIEKETYLRYNIFFQITIYVNH